MKQTHLRNFLLILILVGISYGLTVRFFPANDKVDDPPTRQNALQPSPDDKALAENFQKIPLYFEPNVGQTAEKSSFITRGYGYEMNFFADKVVLSLAHDKSRKGKEIETTSGKEFSHLTMTLAKANKDAAVSGEQEASGKINYIIGNNRDKWLTDIPTYRKIRYKNVYSGIDMIYYGKQTELEFDFAVAPETDPNLIEMNFDGAKKIAKNSTGELVITLSAGDVVLRAPVLYQVDDQGARQTVEGEFAVVNKSSVGFTVGDYDRNRELVIDPVLSYSTFLPGSNMGFDIAVDNDGNAVITGQSSGGVPTTTGATSGGAFVTKFNPQGSSLIFSTRVGGSGSSETGRVVKLDGSGNIVVAGSTSSRDFPLVNPVKSRSNFYVSTNSADNWSNNNNLDDFQVFQIAPSLQNPDLLYATASNRVYRSTNGGSSWTNINNNLPSISNILSLAVNPVDSTQAWIASQSSLYRTVNSGGSWTAINGATVSGSGIAAIVYDPTNVQNIYLATGNAVRKSTDGGSTWASVNTGLPAGVNITALVINPQNPAVLYAGTGTQGVFKTSNGGANWIALNYGISGNNSNIIRKLAIDPATPSTLYVATGNYAGANYIFKTINEATTWSLIYTSPAVTNEIGAIAVSPTNGGQLYVGLLRGGLYRSNDGGASWNRAQTGMWSSSISTIVESPLAAGRIYVGTAQDTTSDDAFVFKLNPNGNSLVFSTILGGSDYEYGYAMDVDPQGNVFLAGTTKSYNFPAVNAVQPRPGFEGANFLYEDGFVTKIAAGGNTILYSTFLGGSSYDYINSIAVGPDGSLAITGKTQSNDFPVLRALQPTNRGNDSFLTKLTPSGNAYDFSTYWGTTGEDTGNSVKFDSASNIIMVGNAGGPGLTTTVNALQPAFAGGANDGFITKFSSDGGQVQFSTYLGGKDSDRIQDIDLDAGGNIYVAGASSSKDFPQVRSVKSRSAYFRSSNKAAKWTNLNTNIYSEIYDFAFSPAQPGVMFAASGDGLVKSTDGGDTWNTVTSAPPALSYSAVEFNPQNPNVIYAAYRDVSGNNPVKLAKSIDGGAAWTPLTSFVAGSDPIYKIVVAPNNPQLIYVATFFSVYKTTDGGVNWQRTSTGDMWPIQDFTVNPANPSTLFVAQQYSGGGIHRSLDGGATWQRMTNGITGQYAEFVVVDPQQPSTVYARTSGGIFRSLDNGDSWALMNFPNFGYRLTVDPHSSQTIYLTSHPTASAPTSGVYRSLDGGTTWSLFNEGMPVSSDFAYFEADPYSPGALHGTVRTDSPSNDDIFVSKLNPSGTSLLYSSVLGGDLHMGNSFQDVAFGVAVTPQGSAFVTGGTSTADFPTTPGAYHRILNNTTLFVARFDPSWSVKGRVTDAQSGSSIPSVSLTLNGSQAVTTESDVLGKYVFSNIIENDNFNLVPRKLGWDFTPQSYSVTSLNEDQVFNFTGVYTTYTITGRIDFGQAPLANATVNLLGSQTGSTITDSNGNFSFTVPKYGDYTVIPSLDGYIFAPQRLTFNNVVSNLRADFTARQGYAIGGQILRNGNPAPGVLVRLGGSENQTTATDSAGRYSFDAGAGGDYLVTPVSETLSFAPLERAFSNLSSNQTGDFTASRIPYAVEFLTYSGEKSFTQSQTEIFNIDDEGFNQQTVTNTPDSELQPSWSPNGRRIAYILNSQLWTADYNGANARAILNSGPVTSMDWSPDGKKLVLSGFSSNIYIVNADGSNLQQLTNDTVGNYSPKWSPDGTKILFARAGKLHTMTPEGANLQRVTTTNAFLSEDRPDWSPDGSEIAFMLYNGSDPRIYLVRTDGTNLRRLTADNDRESSPAWSLRGSRIAYVKGGDSGNIFLVNTDGTVSRQITNNTLRKYSPVWKPRLITSPVPDFDNDGKTDVSIYRPGVGEWWINRSSTAQTVAAQFGSSTDFITPSDFSGDGKTDIAIWRPSTGEWFILRSEDGSFYSVPYGQSSDIPVAGDFDGDFKSDLGVFRPSTGTWYISKSTGGNLILNFGQSGDKPVTADYDGDGRADIAIFRPSDGSWWYLRSSDSQFRVFSFGVSTDKPVEGDYTGDGKADIAVFRPSTGEWFVQRSEDNSFYSVPFGAVGDLPAPGDYDGDGKFDTAIFRPEGSTWYVNRTTAGLMILNFGAEGDKPVPNAFVP